LHRQAVYLLPEIGMTKREVQEVAVIANREGGPNKTTAKKHGALHIYSLYALHRTSYSHRIR
jgi:hypothetical protein